MADIISAIGNSIVETVEILSLSVNEVKLENSIIVYGESEETRQTLISVTKEFNDL